MLEDGVDARLAADARGAGPARVDFRTAFHVATAGGAKALDLPVGQFSPGYQFDAMIVDTRADKGGIRLWDELDAGDDILQKIIYGAARANIANVWVGGRSVI